MEDFARKKRFEESLMALISNEWLKPLFNKNRKMENGQRNNKKVSRKKRVKQKKVEE